MWHNSELLTEKAVKLDAVKGIEGLSIGYFAVSTKKFTKRLLNNIESGKYK